MEKQYLSSSEACEFLGIGKTKLFKLKKEGRLPYIKIDKKLVFDKNDLVKFMDSLKQVGDK